MVPDLVSEVGEDPPQCLTSCLSVGGAGQWHLPYLLLQCGKISKEIGELLQKERN